MAFRTNKVPAIEERTVSGSSVSFNSAFALPLKKCEVAFRATQSGSGTPSPQNVRPIVPVSAVAVTFNGTAISKALGADYGGGTLDLLMGKAVITHVIKKIKDLAWVYGSVQAYFYTTNSDKATGSTNVISDILETKDVSVTVMPNYSIKGLANSGEMLLKCTDYTDIGSMKAAIGDNTLMYPLATPIELSLTPTQLSSIVGNNTFSTDTGILEITFADLQEKSASGAVASFNTALAMPLASCNIAVNAWQEGSGDPSPVNIRPIHGFSEVNLTRAGKNAFRTDGLIYAEPSSTGWEPTNKRVFVPNSYCLGLGGNGYYSYNNQYFTSYTVSNNLIKFEKTLLSAYGVAVPVLDLKQGEKYTISATCQNGNVSIVFYSEDGSYISRENWTTTYRTFTIPNNCKFTVFCFACTTTDVEAVFTDIQLEAGSTATAYEPYVTPTIYTIQLGQEVYGAEVDVVNGVAHVTHKVVDIGSRNLTYFEPSSPTYPYGYFRLLPTDKAYGISNMMCEYYKTSTQPVFTNDFTIIGTRTSYTCYFIDSQHTADDLVDNKAPWLNGYKLVYELYTPFDIQLTPTQIETIRGNNTIFADTGDIDLTYKDLDIAKRGNFREVFRLPS